jgi:hypothetical protein
MWDALTNTGVAPEALRRYVDEQIYTLPGTDRHRDVFAILLTGSRATGQFTARSDVDIDVICPREVYDGVLRASFEAGIIRSDRGFTCPLRGDDWHRYFGEAMGRPHFSITPVDEVERHFRHYDDVRLWVWTNAVILADPGGRVRRIVSGFRGYPPDVLVRKIKYHWLLAAYAGVDVYPYHCSRDVDLQAAATAIVTTVNELLRVFLLVEGKPFPYVEKLMHVACDSKLGGEFWLLLQRAIDLTVGKESPEQDAWRRLRRALESLICSDLSADAQRLEAACAEAMIQAGVPREWVEADYNNIDELLSGELGPAP